jgi:uncharacterized membrane protein
MEFGEQRLKHILKQSEWLRIASWLKKVSWVVVVFACISIVLRFAYSMYRISPQVWTLNKVFDIFISFANISDSLISLGFIFFVLIAFSEILYLLGGIKELIAQIDSDESSL